MIPRYVGCEWCGRPLRARRFETPSGIRLEASICGRLLCRVRRWLLAVLP